MRKMNVEEEGQVQVNTSTVVASSGVTTVVEEKKEKEKGAIKKTPTNKKDKALAAK